MIPKWFYYFNHYLMLGSLGLFVLIVVLVIVTMPFWRFFSLGLLIVIEKIVTWGVPTLLILFAASSAIVVNGFAEHRIDRKWENKKK